MNHMDFGIAIMRIRALALPAVALMIMTLLIPGRALAAGAETPVSAVWADPSQERYITVGTSGYIYKYEGGSWSQMTSPTGETLNGVWGFDWNEVYAVGENGILLGFDGSSWTILPSPASGVQLTSVWGEGVNVWVAGDNGTLKRSSNPAAAGSWNDVSPSTSVQLNDVRGMAGDLYAWSQASSSGGDPDYFVDDNADGSWADFPMDTNDWANDLLTFDGTEFFAGGEDGEFSRSADSGSNWTPYPNPFTETLADLRAMWAAGAGTEIWTVGEHGQVGRLSSDRNTYAKVREDSVEGSVVFYTDIDGKDADHWCAVGFLTPDDYPFTPITRGRTLVYVSGNIQEFNGDGGLLDTGGTSSGSSSSGGGCALTAEGTGSGIDFGWLALAALGLWLGRGIRVPVRRGIFPGGRR